MVDQTNQPPVSNPTPAPVTPPTVTDIPPVPPVTGQPTEPTAKPKSEKKWLLWGLIGFTVILLITAVVLFLQLRKPVEPLPSPRPISTPTPELPPVQQVEGEGVCEVSFTIEELVCTGVTVSPTSTSVDTSETRDLEAQVSGGSGTYTHLWSITSDGIDEGALSSDISNPTDWTAPATLTEPQSWTITDTITDTSTTAQTAECSTTLNFSGLSGCYESCDSNLDCEGTLQCQSVSGDLRCVNPDYPDSVDCSEPGASPSPSPSVSPSSSPSGSPPASTPPGVSPSPRVEQPVLPEAGVSAPLIIGIAAGILLVTLGLLL